MLNLLREVWSVIADLPNRLERNAVDWVARTSPWIAPIPTAYLVYNHTTLYLDWPDWVGWASAIVIECLGLATISTGLVLREYNASKRKSDPTAPKWVAYTMVVVYVLCAELLTVGLGLISRSQDTVTWGDIIPAIFPFFSIAGAVVLSLRADHVRRVEEIQKDKDERSKRSREAAKEAKEEAQSTTNARMSDNVSDKPVVSDNGAKTQADFERAVAIGEIDLNAKTNDNLLLWTGQAIGEWAGKSEATGRRWKREVLERKPQDDF